MPKTHNRDSPRLRFRNEESAPPKKPLPDVPTVQPTGVPSRKAEVDKVALSDHKHPEKHHSNRLSFEESKPKRPSKVVHPIERTVRTASDQLHRQVVQANEDDNVAVTAALKADDARATVLQEGERAFHAR